MNGLLCVTHPRYTVGLIVRDGIVVEAPPYARKWALGRPAEEAVRHAGSQAKYVWLPDGEEQDKT